MEQMTCGSILVIDDDPLVLDSISLFLQEQGFRVIACADATTALEQFHHATIDVVLTDVVLPAISGLDLLEKLHELDPEVPVVLMSGYADLDKAVRAIRAGAFDFIVKPHNPVQLIRSLEKAIQRTKMRQGEKSYKITLEEFNREIEAVISERTMSLMALIIADKVRNPATVIGLTSQRLLAKNSLPEELKENISTIQSEVEKLEAIVCDFQELFKKNRCKFEYENLNEIVEAVLSIFEEEISNKHLDCAVQLSTEPIRINAEKHLIQTALFHIVRNAVEATPESGTIMITTSLNCDTAHIEISDTGNGIPECDLCRIFDPFFSTKKNSFGIGLPLVKQIVSEHLGEIHVRSEVGRGTTFTMSFPLRWKTS